MERQKKYGRDAIRTPANMLSSLRVAASPVLCAAILSTEKPAWALVGAHVLIWSTDWVDGYLSRKYGSTKVGEELDKASDKILAWSEMGALLAKGTIGVAAVAVMGVRDLVLEQYRKRLRKDGISTAAKMPGKIKTNIQIAAIGAALTPGLGENPGIVKGSIWAAATASVLSAGYYFKEGRKERRRRKKETLTQT